MNRVDDDCFCSRVDHCIILMEWTFHADSVAVGYALCYFATVVSCRTWTASTGIVTINNNFKPLWYPVDSRSIG